MYIVLEGIDGCGKTTLANCVAEHLGTLNITAIRLQEPSRGRYGLEIRRRLNAGADPADAELHRLFTLDRRDHVTAKTLPALRLVQESKNFILLQERSYLSAAAYQAVDDRQLAEILEQQALQTPRPDRVFVLDIPVDLAIARTGQRERFDLPIAKKGFLQTVRNRYRQLASAEPELITILDGTLGVDVLKDIIVGYVVSSI